MRAYTYAYSCMLLNNESRGCMNISVRIDFQFRAIASVTCACASCVRRVEIVMMMHLNPSTDYSIV